MSLIVKKVGGSLLKSDEDFMNVATCLADVYRKTPRMIVVVSAMQGETDRLILEAEHITLNSCPARELLLSLGEQKSCALLGLALERLCVPYSIFSGTHIQILKKSDGDYDVNRSAYDAALRRGIVIVSGFHAINENFELVNLGRGGSDFTAILLAQLLGAHACELIKDVPGVFNTSSEWGPLGRYFKTLSFAQMLELIERGVPVVQKEALLFAQKHNLSFRVQNLAGKGTLIL